MGEWFIKIDSTRHVGEVMTRGWFNYATGHCTFRHESRVFVVIRRDGVVVGIDTWAGKNCIREEFKDTQENA